ncbi:putative N-acetyltransferase YsnE [Planctomycetes bacterium Poly30]|uniref:Putative N-acetyltransferase YsnE n=1 Tax=Saltatorellus ferox TaxID=2528018 RepID=A0A518EZ88_9BACT|nr:putative N-acetyltransferase YsnE [Planctomycetes bacterium Poly30]
MRLTPLLLEHATALRCFVDDFHRQGETRIPAFFKKPGWSHEETLEHFNAWERGDPLGWSPETVGRFVPCTTRFLEDSATGELLGVFNFRHRLNESLERFGGHVGYSVRPSARRQGHATTLLRAALERGRDLGLPGLVVTCAPTNEGSARTIERCGGVLRDQYYLETEGTDVNRYWVPVASPMELKIDDLSHPAVVELLEMHFGEMHAHSPAGEAHVLRIERLRDPSLTFWTAWEGDDLLGCGALRELGAKAGEIKSMRTHPDRLRRGAARAILLRIIETAVERGYERLSLETGSGPVFDAAVGLYGSFGFQPGSAFGEYRPNEFSRFFHLAL